MIVRASGQRSNVREMPSTDARILGQVTKDVTAKFVAFTQVINGHRWVEVRLNNVKGFIREDVATITVEFPEAHLNPRGELNSTNGRAFPLLHKPNLLGAYQIADYLDVEKSARYIPTPSATFCNIYAHDFAYLMGAYVPRVFWSPEAWSRILRGETVVPTYGGTVFEMNANALYDWFANTGGRFGWVDAGLTRGQQAANAGKCVILVAANLNRRASGHITVVMPEGNLRADTVRGVVTIPVQSQAGRVNQKVFKSNWWSKGHAPIKCYVRDI